MARSAIIEPIRKNGKIKIINSWLGSNEIIISPNELMKFLSKSPNDRFYLLQKNKKMHDAYVEARQELEKRLPVK